jgi:transposase
MSMVCGLDLHRGQITFDVLEVESGQVWRGRIWSPDRARLRRWLADELVPRAGGEPVAVAVEGCTGWRYVVEEIIAAGFEAHVAEPAETQAARGRKKRAKTDRSDARLLRDLLVAGELPESWIPPPAVLEWRERARLYKSLLDQRRTWLQRIHAELFQHGVSVPEAHIDSAQTRDWLASEAVQLSAAARQRIAVGYHLIDATDAMRLPLRAELERFARRQPACQTLAAAHYGIGPLTAVVVWAELGDCRRFCRSLQVVRHTGLDVTVDQSDRHRGAGHLSRQGPETLRWALFEAGMAACRATSPDRDYFQAVKKAHDGKIAAIAMARKLARRCYHTLRAMDPDIVYAMPS